MEQIKNIREQTMEFPDDGSYSGCDVLYFGQPVHCDFRNLDQRNLMSVISPAC
ncbi:hypothetical protein FHS77_000012 [Paenochrobactrum gallinarii]|uniref:Uncharacterized protein n=1 Tax=Paenochrobactrum gallinarii TaxID=643673 RepID=A0A841M1K3_9HYPH|nr:hypothetical protein [Paenochrobactrum gallinarii]